MHETSTRSPTVTFLTPAPTSLDGADRLVAEDAAVGDRGDVALEDVQVGAADRDGVDPHDGVGVVDDARSRDLLPRLVAGTVVDECAHGSSLVAAPGGASPDGRATPADHRAERPLPTARRVAQGVPGGVPGTFCPVRAGGCADHGCAP